MSVIIYQPVISEKSIQQGSASKYTFRIDPRADARAVRRAIEKLFKVKVTSVNMVCVKGKPKNVGRARVKRAGWKKAIVTLLPGQTIKLFEERKTTEHAN